MAVRLETKSVIKYKPYTDTETVYKTTDDTEFKTEAEAEKHQAKIDIAKAAEKALDEFKARIKYREANDVQFLPKDSYGAGNHTCSFVFIPDVEKFEGSDYSLFVRLTALKYSVGTFEIGKKYIVIEYLDDSGDRDYFGGYYGLLTTYLDELQIEIEKAENYLATD